MMKLWKFAAATVCCAMALVTGCSGPKEQTVEEHQPIRMNTTNGNVQEFIELVHETYPDIEIQCIPYAGQNGTASVLAQLEAGEMPDIFNITVFPNEDLSDRFVDLSGYDFTGNYTNARLREVTADDGGVYLLPGCYNCYGITYNKTILEENGWKVPTSLEELEELAPKAEAAGYQLAINQTQFPGSGFQYLCNIADTGFLSTLGGRRWQKDYLSGKQNVSNQQEMLECMKIIERYKEIGMLGNALYPDGDSKTRDEMAKGNILFMLGTRNDFSVVEHATDEFGLMPYLSEDGDQNVFVLKVDHYVGINKKLQEKGNEQKLEDALHIMEILSTEEGMLALYGDRDTSFVLPLKDASVSEGGYYADIMDELNQGHAAPFIYVGWENAIVEIGNKMLAYMRDEIELDDVIRTMDEAQSLITKGAPVFTTVTETLSTEQCAKAVGIGLAQACGADLSLISINQWDAKQRGSGLNHRGVSGQLYPLPLTAERITSILPTGWKGTIETVTLCGRRIKEIVEKGYTETENHIRYPYVLVTKDDFVMDDAAVYTVVICGADSSVRQEGKVRDTGIVGLTAMQEYFRRFETFSSKDLTWK